MAIPNVITYAYIRGRWYAFADSDSAYAGVTKYNGNAQSLRHSKPVGAIIDDTTLINQGFWPDTINDAPGVSGSALVEPPYNPIKGAGVNTITPDGTNTSAGGGGGGGGGNVYSQGSNLSQDPNLPDDPGVAGRRKTGLYIKGTNILQSEVNANLRSNSGDAQYWEQRLANSDNPNDVLFEMSFAMGNSGTDSGQGNPWVGKLQSGQFRMNEGNTWAQQSVNTPQAGETDVYVQRDADGNPVSVTEGAEWSTQFKHGNWNPGDFSTTKQKNDAATWKTKHDLNARQNLTGDALTNQLNAVQARYDRMLNAQ